ncbi:hypothetical protein [Kitasatospora sp. NPDC058190]|uniref:hypothetical protein n=1 Tax=Kitasatospora sp. NPDC058190 TaxID=3346371 RepID=UPI0036DF64C9
MALQDLAEQVAHDLAGARLELYKVPPAQLVERSLLSMLCHLSVAPMARVSRPGLLTRRVRTHPLSRSQAEEVRHLAAKVHAACSRLSARGAKWGELLPEIEQLVDAIEGIWGRFRGEATLYIPYRIERGPFDKIQASADFRTLTAGGYTCTGLAGQNLNPNTPEVAERNLRDLLFKDITKHGVPLNVQPFPPADGLALTLTVKSPR